jgi:diguanylate cyclase (GGDEF)-like protein/PAS domain S-box-containing protein
MFNPNPIPATPPRRQFADWSLLAAILFCGALISAYFAWSEQRLTEQTEAARMAAQARAVDENLRRQMTGLQTALASVRDAVAVRASDCQPNCGELGLRALKGALPGVRALMVLDRDGKVVNGADTVDAYDFDRTSFTPSLGQMHDPAQVYLLQPKQVTPGVFNVKMAMPLPPPAGGAVVASLDPGYFNRVMQSVLYAPDMRVAISEEGGRRVMFVPERTRSSSTGYEPAQSFFDKHVRSGQLVTVMEGRSVYTHDRRLVVQRSVLPDSTGLDRALVVKVSRNLDELLRPSRHLAWANGVAWLLLALASVTVLLTVQRRRRALLEWPAQRQAERVADAERVEMALDGAGLGLWEWRLSSNRKSLDARAAAMIGYTVEQANGEPDWMQGVHPDDRDTVGQSLARHLHGQAPAFEVDYRRRHANGSWIWIHSRGKVVERDAGGRPQRMLGTSQEISARKLAEAESAHLAFHDSLTNLPNRRLLHDRLTLALAKSERNGRAGAVLLVDLDNFKNLNDILGHDMGDRLLQQVAARLTGVTRASDTVARLGGDEFVIMLDDLDDAGGRAAEHAALVADKMLRALSAAYFLEGHELYSTPSIGIALYGGQRQPVDELLKQAGMAMYDAKAAGRNTFRFFAPLLQVALDEQAALENDLRYAIQRDELVLYFQPIVDDGGRTICAEALVRWQHPGRGLVGPGQFIPVAERSGLILSIGEWVLAQACEQLAQWTREGGGRNMQVAVNVSARQIRQADFVEQVLRALERSGANPQHLKLELTESVLLHDVEDVIAKMTILRTRGVSFALDDFGTGYSSLSYLQRLPLDELKIDGSFVQQMLGSHNAATIVCSIVALAGSLGLDVVAEGVETEAQHLFLADSGCRRYQGYLIGPPVPADTLCRERSADLDIGSSR